MELNQITVPSKDVENSIVFYQNLGLKLIVKALPNYARFICPDGNATFSIHYQENISAEKGIVVYFEDINLDETVKEIAMKGVVFEELPNDKSWLWREARLKDPDGNQIIIFYAGDNRINPPWKIK